MRTSYFDGRDSNAILSPLSLRIRASKEFDMPGSALALAVSHLQMGEGGVSPLRPTAHDPWTRA